MTLLYTAYATNSKLFFESRFKVASLQEFYGGNLKLPATNTRLGINNTSIIRTIYVRAHAKYLSQIFQTIHI